MGSSGLYIAEQQADPFAAPFYAYTRDGFELGVFEVPELVLRDANASDGRWSLLVKLPHEQVDVRLNDGRWLTVPLFAPDPERAAWRRRKWWGSRSGASMPMWRL